MHQETKTTNFFFSIFSVFHWCMRGPPSTNRQVARTVQICLIKVSTLHCVPCFCWKPKCNIWWWFVISLILQLPSPNWLRNPQQAKSILNRSFLSHECHLIFHKTSGWMTQMNYFDFLVIFLLPFCGRLLKFANSGVIACFYYTKEKL